MTPSVPTARPSYVLRLPEIFTLYAGELVDFERVLSLFNWHITSSDVTVDLTSCYLANFQALTLLIQYMWYLEALGCRVTVQYESRPKSASDMMMKMGGDTWRQVL